MIRALILILATATLGVFVAPRASAEPPSDSAFCAALDDGLTSWEVRVSDCGFMVGAAKWQCQTLASTGSFDQAVQQAHTRWSWALKVSSIITTYAVAAYCPQEAKLLPADIPQNEERPTTAPGNVGSVGRSV